jgi:bacteriorhodopsin
LFLSSIAHLTISLPKVYEWYVKNLKKGINYARWIEYFFSSSVMIIVIGMLVGVYDLSTLILMFGINAMMILFGMIMEVHNQTTEKTNWLSYYFGCITGALPWVVVALYLFGSGEGEYRTKVNEKTMYLERVYVILSLVAKSLFI